MSNRTALVTGILVLIALIVGAAWFARYQQQKNTPGTTPTPFVSPSPEMRDETFTPPIFPSTLPAASATPSALPQTGLSPALEGGLEAEIELGTY